MDYKLKDASSKYNAVRISIASPEKIRRWSYGEVKSHGTLRTKMYASETKGVFRPEDDGLFSEVTFGPLFNFECRCGKYNKKAAAGLVCPVCNVEVTSSRVRRERMAHITLVSPVAHVWMYRNPPSPIAILLDISIKDLDDVINFYKYIVVDGGNSPYKNNTIISSNERDKIVDEFGSSGLRLGTGAETIREILCKMDLEKELKNCRQLLEEKRDGNTERKVSILKGMIESKTRPEWMILTVIPVMPPDLRPLIAMDGNRMAVSDINSFYKRIITRNNRLRNLLSIGAPDIIIKNEKRMLQAAVDSLFDNQRSLIPSVDEKSGRMLKSITDNLKGKQGLFRKNLLGKRVDYAGRSVIVVGPNLKLDECGLPKPIAIEIFKPYVIAELVNRNIAFSYQHAAKMVEAPTQDIVWDILGEVIVGKKVLLNRAPTLHRIGIQAFQPVLVEGHAIKLHPLACTAFNADFDGDQMGVHLPISEAAQKEATEIMLAPHNLIKPSDGAPVAVPSQDMILGIYYITQERPGALGEGMCFKDFNEAILAYENKLITFHSRIKVRISKTDIYGNTVSHMVSSTYGRFLFNEIVPQDIGYVNRAEDPFSLEVDFLVGKKQIKGIIEKVLNKHGMEKLGEFLDAAKNMGYKYSTIAALTVSVSDMRVPPEKPDMIREAEEKVELIKKRTQRGMLSEAERYKQVISVWKDTDEKLTKALLDGMDPTNNLKMMADSGARGSDKQIKQLTGMRGLMADATGHTIELPIKSNFREGLDVLEYFISAHGSRKGMSDTALRTADSGYMTRKLVDVSHEVIITEEDCSKDKDVIPGMEITEIVSFDGKTEKVIETLSTRIEGRYLAENISDEDGNVLFNSNTLISKDAAKQIEKIRKTVKIRTLLTCECEQGVCIKCYGLNLANRKVVKLGEAVGIMAAQSIGEPGTQLTMRTFHTGGVAGGDITQGLPRVEEIFEARPPKGKAVLSEIDGYCSFKEREKDKLKIRTYTVVADDGTKKKYPIPYNSTPRHNESGFTIKKGEALTVGSIDPNELMKLKGINAAMSYMLADVLTVYSSQAVDINDKHVEVILRQMTRFVRIENPGDSNYDRGEIIELPVYNKINNELIADGKEPAAGKRLLYGITKASVRSTSFLSGASFQNTSKVLTDAAVKGKTDYLVGIKENVILGRLIPAGTGLEYKEKKNPTIVDDLEEYF